MANIIPADTHNIATSYLAGDVEQSRKLHLRTFDLIKALFVDVNPIPVKEAMNLMGMNVGKCRMPLVDMDEANKAILVKAMKDYGLI